MSFPSVREQGRIRAVLRSAYQGAATYRVTGAGPTFDVECRYCVNPSGPWTAGALDEQRALLGCVWRYYNGSAPVPAEVAALFPGYLPVTYTAADGVLVVDYHGRARPEVAVQCGDEWAAPLLAERGY